MQEIYMVTAGEYSAYSVIGVFTTQEKAQAFMTGKPISHEPPLFGYNEIEAIPVDMEIPPEIFGKLRYSVYMKKNGESVVYTDDEPNEILKPFESTLETNNDKHSSFFAPNEQYVYVSCSTISKDAAVKIANEIRVQKIAMGEFR